MISRTWINDDISNAGIEHHLYNRNIDFWKKVCKSDKDIYTIFIKRNDIDGKVYQGFYLKEVMKALEFKVNSQIYFRKMSNKIPPYEFQNLKKRGSKK